MVLQSIKFDVEFGLLEILDQLLLPEKTQYIKIKGVEDGWSVINKMQVRGAPAIAIVGSLSLAVEIWKEEFQDKKTLLREIEGKLNYLISARPTAVNMKLAADELLELAIQLSRDETCSTRDMKKNFIDAITMMLDKDIADNKNIGKHGSDAILSNLQSQETTIKVLTHCNTGSLATAGYGTALGVVRRLHEMKRLDRVYLTETRPYNQGARLTAFEMVHDKVPATLICDSMVAYLFQKKHIQAVLVGADRVAMNGDTANKIGTYQIACLAALHDVPFYVCAPFTSIDSSKSSGDSIVIEERPEHEMTYIAGKRIAAPGISVWNPAFDVTPAKFIRGIITERGVFECSDLKNQLNL
ncbi:CLUMA_CG019495, isoform A [Clunio marinus]|uniref:Methylthioribose-1-phosphate isomerase n=1 Tax=Clunio marinus TaxID=568069 RepID=A0A1J1J4Z4_9DIPT|nr:CLUMA_CG019495, isoform A [Clunio marinus]